MEEERTRDNPSRAPSNKPCRFFHQNDCYRGDKCHMVHAPKAQFSPCKTHQFWLEDPWTRPACEWEEKCPRTHPFHSGPDDPELRRTNVALQTESSQLSRVRTYAVEVLGAGGAASVTGVARSGTSRYNQKLLLLEAVDPEAFSRACIADPSLCRAILRVYLLGGGMCTSLEDVGRTLAEEVATGKYAASPGTSISNFRVEEGGDRAAALAVDPSTLLVRVQALPKVMERQLVDEVSPFWDDSFPGLVRERQGGLFTHVLSVIFVRGAFLYGLAPADTHGRCIMENNQEDSAVCRAFYKIKEATARAGISYDNEWTAIDVGSSPGGWTSFLAARCRRVLSVDPAELDPEVLALPNVVHVRQTAQAARGRLVDLLIAGEGWPRDESGRSGCDAAAENGVDGCSARVIKSPDWLEPPAGRIPKGAAGIASAETGVGIREVSRADVIVSDMNAEPQVVADVLLSCLAAGLAKPGALLVATFKDFCGRKKMGDEVAMAVSCLEAGIAADDTWSRGESLDSTREAEWGSSNERGDVAIAVGESVEESEHAVIGQGQGGNTSFAAAAGVHLAIWKLEHVQTMRLLSGGRAEQTIIARVARATP